MNEKVDRAPESAAGHMAKLRGRLFRIAAYSAPTIITLQATAYAGTESPTQGVAAPLFDPSTLVALGTTLATVGAYRLMKARKRADRSGDGEREL